MITQETQGFLIGSSLCEDDNTTSCVLVLSMAIGVVLDLS
jgi:hypothetical protein